LSIVERAASSTLNAASGFRLEREQRESLFTGPTWQNAFLKCLLASLLSSGLRLVLLRTVDFIDLDARR
jgi:hypothetical protein